MQISTQSNPNKTALSLSDPIRFALYQSEISFRQIFLLIKNSASLPDTVTDGF